MARQKACSKCKEPKDLKDFYWHRNQSRLYSSCRKCHSELAAAANRRRRAAARVSTSRAGKLIDEVLKLDFFGSGK